MPSSIEFLTRSIQSGMAPIALIAGVTGIVGNNLAQRLLANGWEVHRLARRPASGIDGINSISAALLDPTVVRSAVVGLKPSHVFITTWLRQPTEVVNIRINSAMVRNLLKVVSTTNSVRHVALVTGLKHYLGPFEAYGKGKLPATPFREEQPRLNIENFYYAQEDELFAAAARHHFTWNIHRPHTIIGYALGNAMNMGVTLAVYATICRETGRPFVYPGSHEQGSFLTDVCVAGMLAQQLEWAAITPKAHNQAFNTVNGDIFRWRWLWPQLAAYFGVEAAPPPAETAPLETQMSEAAPLWAEIAAKYGLVESNVDKLASWWHTDA